ncbi:zinc finger protein 888-like isoform X2 [Planococcus citri]|uniref:zinc finger protein 888-like isoform X2 n=1 Tax=Planococcus citri TaxID=170843 RepID=UPI0031F88EB4
MNGDRLTFTNLLTSIPRNMEIDASSSDVCRLCAENYDKRFCYPLYDENKRERTIAKQINQLVVNLVSPDDGLPQKICFKCSKNVEMCYSFVCNVIETQNKLKRLKSVTDQKQKRSSGEDFIEKCRSYTTLRCDELPSSTGDQSCILNGNEDGDTIISFDQNERENNTTAVVDDFIELLVVHPEEMVDVDVNGMLESSPHFVDVNQQNKMAMANEATTTIDQIRPSPAPLLSSSSISSKPDKSQWQPTTCDQTGITVIEGLDNVASSNDQQTLLVIDSQSYMDEDEDDGDDAFDDDTMAAIKEEPKEIAFTTDEFDEEILELQEDHQVTWVYDDSPKEDGEECEIVYKCGSCGNTYQNEALFQSHNCEGSGDDYGSAEIVVQIRGNYDNDGGGVVSKNKTMFQCDICNRIFKSKLVFKLHYAQHKKPNVCQLCNACFLDPEDLQNHLNQAHPGANYNLDDSAVYEEVIDSEKQCDVCGKITDNLKQHKLYHAIKELEYCKAENKKYLKKWFFCQQCNKKIFSEANFLFHVAKHNGEDTVTCRQCDFVAVNIQDYNMHITTHTGGKYFICNDCEKCFFTRSAISDHVLIHMDGTRYMCEICGKRFKTSRSNAQHKLLQHKKYFRCNRCNRGFTHEAKLKSHYNICRVINQDQKESKVFEPVEKFFCNICNSNIKSSSEISILFHKAKHEGKEGVVCKFCNLLCKNACMYKNHLLIHTNQRPYACTQCPKSFRTKGCLVQHMLVHGDEYKYTCEYCGKKSKKLTTHVNHVNIHTGTKPYKCPDCDRPFRQLSDMKKHRKTHLKYKNDANNVHAMASNASNTVTVTTDLPYLTIKTEVEDMIAAESIQQLQLA